MDEPIRIAVIGAGGIFQTRHLPNMKDRDDIELAVVCNRSQESSRAVAQEFGFREIDTDWQAVVQREDIDAVMIGTWPYKHREMSVAALEAGKHVFCQARMAMNLKEALDMLDAAEQASQQVSMICPPPHRMPWEPYIRQVLSEGRLGDLLEVRVISSSDANLGPITWREQVEYSGQQILQMGIIAETLNAWVGPYRSLRAFTSTPIAYKTTEDGSNEEVRIPQVVSIAGLLENGTPIYEHHSGVAAHDPVNAAWFFGSEATLRVDFMNGISLGKTGQALEPVDVPADMQNPWQVEEEFIAAVKSAQRDEPFHVSPDFHEGLRYMQKVAAVHESAETGREITLAELER